MVPAGANSQTLLAARRIREFILSGELGPDERLSEIPLSERIGVSRTPLRLALAQLEHEGLLDRLSTGGFVVRRFSYVDAVDAIELRGVLEGTAARLAAERLQSRERLHPIRRHCAQLAEIATMTRLSSDDVSRYIQLNDAFHSELVELAQSDILKRSMERVIDLPFASPSAFVDVDAELLEPREWLVVAHAQHVGIVEAIANGEGTRAEALGREHARATRRSLDAVIAERDGLDQPPGDALGLLRGGSRPRSRPEQEDTMSTTTRASEDA